MYIKGANTEPSAIISREPKIRIIITMGISINFFLEIKNVNSSFKNSILFSIDF